MGNGGAAGQKQSDSKGSRGRETAMHRQRDLWRWLALAGSQMALGGGKMALGGGKMALGGGNMART